MMTVIPSFLCALAGAVLVWQWSDMPPLMRLAGQQPPQAFLRLLFAVPGFAGELFWQCFY
ncbi:TPA: hypothetical protein JW546_003986 [Escherichia coli]|nr:hypothetical protein [Escherichia coli]HAX1982239.1 hypothetical protein [Escherichia coli]HBQ4880617.1 hypothetical protein [Escherichia coli]HDH7112102.1 hypothetical protein [Escherichia coli]